MLNNNADNSGLFVDNGSLASIITLHTIFSPHAHTSRLDGGVSILVKVTMLNSMAGEDFEVSLNNQRDWGVGLLDLKDSIFGKSVLELSDAEAVRAAKMIQDRNMNVYCLSTSLFYDDVEKGEDSFNLHLSQVNRAIHLGRILHPTVIRLLSPRSRFRGELFDGIAYLKKRHSWLFSMYQTAIDQIINAGFQVTIENEVHGCLMGNADEIIGFFETLSCDNRVFFTYDVQNLWQMGTYPDYDVVNQLAPLTGYLHLKGGRSLPGEKGLYWSSGLEDASWDVAGVLERVLSLGCCSMVCLNPSHGRRLQGYPYGSITLQDLAFVRSRIAELAPGGGYP